MILNLLICSMRVFLNFHMFTICFLMIELDHVKKVFVAFINILVQPNNQVPCHTNKGMLAK